MNDAEILERAVQRVFGKFVAFAAHSLSNDRGNRSWLVTHPDGRCIARFPEHSGGLTISPALEYELLRLAADAGIAPRPVGYDSITGIVFVEELVAHANLSEQQARQSAFISQIADSLRTLHSVAAPKSLRRFDPLAFAQAYCAGIRGTAAHNARALRDECHLLSVQCAHLLRGAYVCHNDLHAGNILVGENIRLIDFEYAVQAAPIVDVASYVAYNNLDDAAALTLAQACLKNAWPYTPEELQAVVRLHRLLGELWEIARTDNNGPS